MKFAVLPFNAAEGTRPALGRQIANFASDTVRSASGAEINTLSYLRQIDDSGRAAYFNVSTELLEPQWIADLFEQTGVDRLLDGLIKESEDGSFELTLRVQDKGAAEPATFDQTHYPLDDIFIMLQNVVRTLAKGAEAELPEALGTGNIDFGTENAKAFLDFLLGYDALMYVQQSSGRVATEFSPEPALNWLLESIEADRDFEGSYQTLVQLCRACANFKIGSLEMLESALKKAIALVPEAFEAYFGLGEVYQSVNDSGRAAEMYEQATIREPNDPALWVRLGLSQMGVGMPVNAERNFRKAIELEGEDKPSTDYLAMVLQQTGREHEVPPLWKSLVDANPTNPNARAKHAISLIQSGRADEGVAAFEAALEAIEENAIIKRFYAPLLVQREELDRAMDFYEDCLDESPADVQLLMEYAQTLQKAGRDFEIPKVLKDVLACNPDPNTRAQVTAWLLELEQPKRTDVVEAARVKLDNGDFSGAVRDLKPMRTWLADYWKLWAMLSSAYNRLGESTEAEEAARTLLQMFPACEPAYGELMQAMSAQGKHDEAYTLMKFAASNMPQSLPLHVNLALAAKRAGHSDEARALAKQLREAVGPNPDLESALSEVDR